MLAALVRDKNWNFRAFRTQFTAAAGRVAKRDEDPDIAHTDVTERTYERWRSGRVRSRPQLVTCRVLEEMFGHPVRELLAPREAEPRPGDAGGQAGTPGMTIEEMLTMAARKARQFTANAEESNIGDAGLDQLREEAAALAETFPATPVDQLAGRLVALQEETFTRLEGRQPPHYTRKLHEVAALANGMLAKAAHDLGSPRTAMTTAQTAWMCASFAENAPLQAWVRGLESLISFWAGRPRQAREYAAGGLELPGVAGTVRVWLHALDARAAAALGDAPAAMAAVHDAEEAREQVIPDDLDAIGGMCAFAAERQDYYAAHTGTLLPKQLSGSQIGRKAGRYAEQAIDVYEAAPAAPSFGDLAGARVALAITRIRDGELDGAAEAVAPVLELPPPMRINGVRTCLHGVHRELAASASRAAIVADVQQEIEAFGQDRPRAAL